MLRTLVAALALAALVPVRAQTPLPRVRVEGNRFVGPDGATLVFRGLSFSDPDKLEREGHWDAAYFDAARSWGANVVRFPVHPSAWRARGPEAYLRLVDAGVALAAERGMYVILDWHSIGNLRTELYQHPMYHTTRTETFGFWQTVAARYGADPTVAFYELFNEPTSYRGTLGRLTWSEHRETMEDLIAVVRANAPEAVPLVAGPDWAYDLTGVREDPVRAPGVAYVAHPYPQKRTEPWAPKWEEAWGFVAETYPVVATELGFMSADGPGAHVPVIADETYGRAVVDFFEARGISWTPWVFDPQWAPQLIEDWSFAPTRQGAFFRDRIRELNGAPRPSPSPR